MPVMLAPIGLMQHFHADGASPSGQAAAEFGTIQAVSTNTQPSLEKVAAASDGPKIFQLNVRGDRAWTREIIERAREARYIAVAVTASMALTRRRERTMSVEWAPRSRTTGADDPPNYMAMLSWETLDEIKEMCGPEMPLMLKGVQTAEDAMLAVQHGVDTVWISNHGGRQLDHGRGTLDELPEVIEAVAGKADVMVDGGIQRGTDVLKALALGAKAVAVGKLQCWGLAAGGKDGVRRMLEILEEEIVTGMGLLGVTSIDQLNASYVRRAEAVTLPHEMSSWVNLPGGRVL